MIRKATLTDAPAIQRLINGFADRGKMLPRPLAEIYENIREYFVAVERGRVAGTAALHINWDDLAEIKSVAVAAKLQGRGTGQALVEACLAEGRCLGIRRFYVLTYVPDFFRRFGFKRVDRKTLPHKVWTECVKCSKFPDCDETAMVLLAKAHGRTRA
jgi:amino-acid N-acetyltransferase